MKNVVLENVVSHNIKSDAFYCYLLLDPSTREVFYVGKGKRNRFRDHLYPYTSKNKHKNAKVKKILEQSGHYITQIVYTAKDEDDAYRFETHLVKQYPNLTNKTEGGSDAPKRPTRRVVQYNLYGEPICTHDSYLVAADAVSTDAHIASQILECCRGATATCMDFYWSYEGSKILKPRTKIRPIKQFALNGTYITRYTSAAEAGRVLNCDGRDLLVAIRHGWSSQGYNWQYHSILNT